MAYAGMKEEQMLINYVFSVSAGNIIESSNSASSMDHQYSPSSGSESSKITINNIVKRKNPGASNKTRKKMNSQTQTMKTTSLTDDGYGWRKYGQKIIHNEQHPKSYYRCTHYNEEKCLAKKWVQQESDNPPVYKTTYIGHHTCKNPLRIPQILYPDYSSSTSSPDNMIGSFDHNYYSSMSQQQPILLRFDLPDSNHVSNIQGEQMNGQMEPVASPPSIPTVDVDSMMFSEGLENETYGNESDYYFPSIPSPNCDFGSYDFNMMMLDELLNLDHVNFMQEC